MIAQREHARFEIVDHDGFDLPPAGDLQARIALCHEHFAGRLDDVTFNRTTGIRRTMAEAAHESSMSCEDLAALRF